MVPELRVHDGVAGLMAQIARLEKVEVVPVREMEPISLNAAKQIAAFLITRNIKSVAVVTSGFRSARSLLVYQAVLAPTDIRVSCVPVFGQTTPESWAKSWHGIQNVTEQFFKLQYTAFMFFQLTIGADRAVNAGKGHSRRNDGDGRRLDRPQPPRSCIEPFECRDDLCVGGCAAAAGGRGPSARRSSPR